MIKQLTLEFDYEIRSTNGVQNTLKVRQTNKEHTMRTSTIKQTGCIHSIERLNSSAMGNPRFSLRVSLSKNGTSERTTIETSPNSGIAYSIDQSMLCGSSGGLFEFTYHITAKRGTKILDSLESLNKRHEREREASKQRWAVIDQRMDARRDRLAKEQATFTGSTADTVQLITSKIDFQSKKFAQESRRYRAMLSMFEAKLDRMKATLRGDQS
jgi:hypothetical protein